MERLLVMMVVATTALGSTACDGDTSTDVPQQETFAANLTGAAEVPPVTTAASGSVTVVYDPVAGNFG
jgi:hypothetical protein